MIGQLNRRVTIKSWISSQDDSGGLISTQGTSYDIWARVEDRSGRTYLSQQQEQWSYDYKITFRYEVSRPVTSNMTIDYDSKRLVIRSLSFESEGGRRFCIARCSAIEIIES